MFLIKEKEVLSSTVSKFVVEAPFIARKRKPGNFVIIRVAENGERIPLTIVDGDTSHGTITLIVQGVGKTTKLLLGMEAGDAIIDMVGPLGNPTPVERHGNVVCIGGGVGTAELFPITRALKEAGNTIMTIVGARTKDLVILETEMASCSDELFITTDDGSYGRKGFVTDQLKDLLERPAGVNAVYAIGPLPMMKAVAALTKKYGVHTIVSLNTIMVDGTGMCGGCRVTVNKEMKFACVDGPEFDAHTVDFDELMMRNRTYVDLEKAADHNCRRLNAELPEGMSNEAR
jgi:ferredoxin--NADP+ reductase